jgi:hypothetical protein
MMKSAWFNENGAFNFWDETQQASADQITLGYVKADIDDEIPIWRFKYNSETASVDIAYEGMSIAESEAAVDEALAAKAAEEQAAADAIRAERLAAELGQ